MRFFTALLAWGLTASAEPLYKRQSSGPVATKVLGDITTKLNEMDKAITGFKWTGKDQDALTAVPILDVASAILAIMRDGSAQIKGAPQLGLGETIGILGPLGSLTNAVNKVVTGLKSRKADFESSALTAVVVDQLVSFDWEAKALVKETLDKLPLPTGITSIFAQPILTALGEVLTFYGGSAATEAPASAPAPAPAPAPKASPKAKSKGKRPGSVRRSRMVDMMV
jgi:hypothetical protein